MEKSFEKHKKKLIPKHVEHVVIQVNNSCFFKCEMCNIWKKKENPELKIDNYSKFLNDLKFLKGPNTQVIFTGGETLLSKQLFELISLASKLGFNNLVNTNGWLLDESMIKKLFDSGMTHMMISIDGFKAKTHDKIRGTKGSHKKVLSGAKKVKNYYNSKKKRLDLVTISVISKSNLNEILDLTEMLQKLPFIDYVHFQAITTPFSNETIVNNYIQGIPWYEHKNYKHLWPSDKKKLLEIYTKLIYYKKKGYKIGDNVHKLKMQYLYFLYPNIRLRNTECTIYKDLFIDLEGNIYHCNVKKEKIGNIHFDSLSNLWNKNNAIQLRKNILNCNINCHQLLNCGHPKTIKTLEFI